MPIEFEITQLLYYFDVKLLDLKSTQISKSINRFYFLFCFLPFPSNRGGCFSLVFC